jgi:hypothetical protein
MSHIPQGSYGGSQSVSELEISSYFVLGLCLKSGGTWGHTAGITLNWTTISFCLVCPIQKMRIMILVKGKNGTGLNFFQVSKVNDSKWG